MLQKACIDCSVWFLCSRQESRSEMAGLSSSRTRRWPTLAVRGSWHTPAHSDTLLAGQTVFLLIINAWIYWRLQTSITRTHCSKCIYYSTLFSWFSTIYNCYWIVVQGVPIKSDPPKPGGILFSTCPFICPWFICLHFFNTNGSILMQIGTTGPLSHCPGNSQFWGSGGQRSGSENAKDRFGWVFEAFPQVECLF